MNTQNSTFCTITIFSLLCIIGSMVTTDIVLLAAIILHEEGVMWRILNSLHIDGDHPDGNASKELHPTGIYINNQHHIQLNSSHTQKVCQGLQLSTLLLAETKF